MWGSFLFLRIAIHHIHERDCRIYHDSDSLFEERMCYPYTEHRPEKYDRYDIRAISTLIVRREEECESEYSDSPVQLWDTPTRESE